MYVGTYVRMYVCTYVCTYVRMYVCTYVGICRYVPIYFFCVCSCMSTSTNVNIKSPNFSCMSSTALEMHPYQYHIDACYTPTISPPSSTPKAKPPNPRVSPHGPYIYILSYAYEYKNRQHNSLPISHTLCNATATAQYIQYKPKQLGYTILGWVLSCDATKFISHKVLKF